MSEDDVGPLSDHEFHTLVDLLRRYGEHDLDQFALWRLGTTYGEVYVSVSRSLIPGTSSQTYLDLDEWRKARG
ncbi:hypothetical protein [Bailinhaonella thermotolerans]|uniref:Uncharacterized protein n=1 Tax=Bailinhaonella thermotolerans TaxID=1070861 RepID=A0A3A4BM32_9ACTN|nr:hypothetical protein [Bailinhaonella thermotolerans]RJL32082.1 hypothetical protein D5H75_16795 [Bailinhaonella thermotolerans]